MNQNVAHALTEFIARLEVETVFGLSGANIEALFHEIFAHSSLKGIIAKHEAAAVHMAMGSVKAGAPIGVVAVTSGGGAFNTISPLSEAYSESTPILVIMGQVSQEKRGVGSFQESSGLQGTPDLFQAASAVSRWCEVLESLDDLADLLHDALATLRGPHSGPAVLMIPQNFFAMELQEEIVQPLPIDVPKIAHIPVYPQIENRNVVALLGGDIAKQHILAGVTSLMNKLQIPVTVTADAKGVFDNHHHLYAGVAGIMGNPSAQELLDEAEVVIVLGARLSQVDLFGWGGDLSVKEVYVTCENECFANGETTSWGNDIATVIELLNECYDIQPRREAIHVTHLLDETIGQPYEEYAKVLSEQFSSKDHIVVDAGNCGGSMVHYLSLPFGASFDIALGMGGMGYSFGAALGAAQTTGNRAWVLAGDGAFFIHGFEVHTALEYHLPVTFVIFDNQAHAMCETREQTFFCKPAHYNSFKTTLDGEGLGALFPKLPSYDVADANALAEFFSNQTEYDGPILVVVKVPENAHVPFLPFLSVEGCLK